MAAIDKTYTSDYREYRDFKKWAKTIKCKFPYEHIYGEQITIIDCVYLWHKRDFDGVELPIMNTPKVVDAYLIKYCPFPFVQDRMKEVYGLAHYNKVLNSLDGDCV
jgi:hypothetical protein